MRCPTCKNEALAPWEQIEETFGVKAMMRGLKCDDCGEFLVRGNDLVRYERDIALRVLVRGVRTGAEFKFVRKAAGLRATDLATLLGVDPKTVSRWETGESAIPRAELYVLRDLFEQRDKTTVRLMAIANA